MQKLVMIMVLLFTISCAYKTKQDDLTVPEHPAADEVDSAVDTDTSDYGTDTGSDSIEVDAETKISVDTVEPSNTEVTPVPTEAETLGISNQDLVLAKAIFKWKMKTDHGIWVECGRKYNKEGIKTAAIEWAQAINAAHATAYFKLRNGKTVQVDIKEAVGVIINESRFDRCAVGPYPRKFAYKRGLLKRKKGHISHSLEELEKVFNHPAFDGRKADIGGAQIVVTVGKKYTTWKDISQYLSVVPGVQIIFDEMADRGRMYSTRTPSDRWPGSAKHTYYTTKILRKSKGIFKHT